MLDRIDRILGADGVMMAEAEERLQAVNAQVKNG